MDDLLRSNPPRRGELPMDYYSRIGAMIGENDADKVRLKIRSILRREKVDQNFKGLLSLSFSHVRF